MASSLSEKTMSDLTKESPCFVIPYEQRGYRWRVINLLELLDDLIEFVNDPTGTTYCLQPLAVSQSDTHTYRVWDGQQRLTTLYLLMKSLGIDSSYSFIFERDENNERSNFLINPIFRGNHEKSIDLFFIGRARHLFDDCINNNEDTTLINRSNKTESELYKRVCRNLQYVEVISKLKLLLKGELMGKCLKFLWYLVDECQATAIFMDINSGKISLTNTELIKALLLSESSVISKPELTAMQFSDIEQGFMNDNLWHMIQPQEFKRTGNGIEQIRGKDLQSEKSSTLLNKRLRFDLLFNLVAGVDFKLYQQDPLASFRYFYDNREQLDILWEKVRNYYRILQSIYSDMEAYHFVGYLTYQSPGNSGYKRIRDLLTLYKSTPRDKFISKLKNQIKVYQDPDTLDFNKDKARIRCCLLLHNILTLIKRYKQQQNNSKLRLEKPFETFPFELLYRQEWNIEHINPATDNPLKNEEDQMQWIESAKFDYPELFVKPSSNDMFISRFSEETREQIIDLYNKFISSRSTSNKQLKEESFNAVFEAIIEASDALAGDDAIQEKYCIGNYVLLDETTNKSFHNALFPTKRRIIIAASGQQNDMLDHEVKLAYVPPCTRAAFMKFYNTRPAVSLTQWGMTDVTDYKKNIIDLQNEL